jgi:hypothetical protein
MLDSVDAMRSACRMDDRRVLGGIKFDLPPGNEAIRSTRADATRRPEHSLEITFNGDFNMGGLIRALHYLGAIGASRTLDIAIDDRDIRGEMENKGIPSKLGWDGDGADKIISCSLDGVNILK